MLKGIIEKSPFRFSVGVVASLVILGVLVVSAIVGPRIVSMGTVSPLTNPTDFRAFYCAGRAILDNRNPMLIEPLRSCEVVNTKLMGLVPVPQMVNAAPQPPFGLVAFAGIALLPFPAATCAWLTFLIICTIVTVSVLRSLTTIRPAVVALVIVSGNFIAYLSGESGPIVVLAIVLAANSVTRSRFWQTAFYLSVGSIAPHIALPVWIALIVRERKALLPLLLFGMILAVIPLFVMSTHVWNDYFFKELPAHSISELHAFEPQYSLTTFLSALHFSERLSLTLGKFDYLSMIALGVFVGNRLACKTKHEELSILIPSAFVALGGMFVHLYQLSVVFPAALCLACLPDRRLKFAMHFCIASVLLSMTLDIAYGASFFTPLTQRFQSEMQTIDPMALASVAIRYWHEEQSTNVGSTLLYIFLIKLPAVLGLSAFVAFTTASAFAPTKLRVDGSRSSATPAVLGGGT